MLIKECISQPGKKTHTEKKTEQHKVELFMQWHVLSFIFTYNNI